VKKDLAAGCPERAGQQDVVAPHAGDTVERVGQDRKQAADENHEDHAELDLIEDAVRVAHAEELRQRLQLEHGDRKRQPCDGAQRAQDLDDRFERVPEDARRTHQDAQRGADRRRQDKAQQHAQQADAERSTAG